MAEKSVRHNFVLKSGIGTVAAEDYNKDKHGPVVEETDEQYERRIHGRVAAVPGPPTTTIVGLATFEAADIQKAAQPIVVMPVLGVPVVSQRVAVAVKDEKDAKAAEAAGKK